MFRLVRKLTVCLLAVVFTILLLLAVSYGVKGYTMYQDAVTEQSLDARVEEVRSVEDFVTYSELPEFYIEAVISVEDHRFEKHCGIDLIAIGRACV